MENRLFTPRPRGFHNHWPYWIDFTTKHTRYVISRTLSPAFSEREGFVRVYRLLGWQVQVFRG